jgi:hypothetical protein
MTNGDGKVIFCCVVLSVVIFQRRRTDFSVGYTNNSMYVHVCTCMYVASWGSRLLAKREQITKGSCSMISASNSIYVLGPSLVVPCPSKVAGPIYGNQILGSMNQYVQPTVRCRFPVLNIFYLLYQLFHMSQLQWTRDDNGRKCIFGKTVEMWPRLMTFHSYRHICIN